MDHADHYLSPAQLLRFNDIAKAFAKFFSREQITVLPMEWMADAPQRFADRLVELLPTGNAGAIAKAIQQPRNVRPRSARDMLTRQGRTSQFFQGTLAAWRASWPPAEVMKRVRCFAAPHMEMVAERFDLPLCELGYF